VDFSGLPGFVIEGMRDAADVQVEWLKVLARRTQRFRDSLPKERKKHK
jgi:hypothetical protein